jgi:hypothetical protein
MPGAGLSSCSNTAAMSPTTCPNRSGRPTPTAAGRSMPCSYRTAGPRARAARHDEAARQPGRLPVHHDQQGRTARCRGPTRIGMCIGRSWVKTADADDRRAGRDKARHLVEQILPQDWNRSGNRLLAGLDHLRLLRLRRGHGSRLAPAVLRERCPHRPADVSGHRLSAGQMDSRRFPPARPPCIAMRHSTRTRPAIIFAFGLARP